MADDNEAGLVDGADVVNQAEWSQLLLFANGRFAVVNIAERTSAIGPDCVKTYRKCTRRIC